MKKNSFTEKTISLRLAQARTGTRVSEPQLITVTDSQKLCLLLAIATLFAALSGCGTAKVSQQKAIGAAPITKPATVYVADFDLDAVNVKSNPGLHPPPPKLPGPFGDTLPSLPGTPKDPQIVARQIVDEMSAALVKDLTKAGMNARRLAARETVPTNGWLVRGVFTDVNQGNQLQRAVIGFGVGKTDLQVNVALNDLAQGRPRTFYKLHTAADSGKVPGDGPTIVLGPAGVAARYVIAGQDLNRNVKQTASKIAAEVSQRTKQTL
jgi:hypothetical protein